MPCNNDWLLTDMQPLKSLDILIGIYSKLDRPTKCMYMEKGWLEYILKMYNNYMSVHKGNGTGTMYSKCSNPWSVYILVWCLFCIPTMYLLNFTFVAIKIYFTLKSMEGAGKLSNALV